MPLHKDRPLSEDSDQSDEVLLRQYIEQHDESALKKLIEMHSSLVMSVCQQVLRNQHDAEEAFQETFLKLVNKTESIQDQRALSSWLYQVAYREAINLTRQNQRNKSESMQEEQIVPSQPSSSPEFDELVLLHEELNDLPDKYRAPIVLCYLEGKSRQEAAQQLQVTLESLKTSLKQGRNQLQQRLLKRGIAIGAVLTAWQTAQVSAGTWASASVVEQTLAGCLEKSTTAAGTTSISSVPVSKSVFTKGATWMAVSMGEKVGIGVISILIATISISTVYYTLIDSSSTPNYAASDQPPDSLQSDAPVPIITDVSNDPLQKLKNAGCTLEFGENQLHSIHRYNQTQLAENPHLIFSDNEAELLEQFPTIRVVRLGNRPHDKNKITDKGLKSICKLRDLWSLGLEYTAISNEGLLPLKNLNLVSLNLYGTNISDEGLQHIAHMSKLKTIDLSETQITDKVMDTLNQLSNLSSINMHKTEVTKQGLLKLKNLKNLTEIAAYESGIQPEDLPELEKAFPNTKIRIQAEGWFEQVISE